MLSYRFILMLTLYTLIQSACSIANAADYDAGNANELIDAIIASNDNAESDIITLTDDIILTSIYPDPGVKVTGLPKISGKTTIEGGGYTISRSTEANTPDFRIFFVDFMHEDGLFLNNVTVRNGRVTGSSNDGGAILLNASGKVTLNNSSILDSYSDLRGGAIHSHNGTITLNNSTISNNYAKLDGGGIFGIYTVMTINNSKVMDNSSGENGGGISFIGTDQYIGTINNSTISGNSTRVLGGGIYHFDVPLNIDNSTISGNITTDAYGAGGGIYFKNGLVSLINTTVSGNLGGGIASSLDTDGTININNSTITDNEAGDIWGGGLYISGGVLTLYSTIIAGNRTTRSFPNCYLAPNRSSGQTDLGNNLTEATASDGCNSDYGDSDFGDIEPGIDFSTTLADNGGPTQTHALLNSMNNPAVDSSGAGATTTDQRGVGVQGASRDIGAYELEDEIFQNGFE